MSSDLAAAAARIQAAAAAGEICPLVGRAARVRILRMARLVDAGQMLPVEGRFLAMEAEALAMALAPLPASPLPVRATDAQRPGFAGETGPPE
ncbi:hypothetical protein [Methylobacterium sp. yr596]|uniref:hypothetical protein n=1 Tax=Methylobacterium sp. yr596 TaxID=1761800 RepID=UPI0008DF647C|nr:hypothetical protein [Methylobacterium sp. yr596]SFE90390.1 hypothetical protein SAMN04487844_107137 [Methylobacterium sp. yr596]